MAKTRTRPYDVAAYLRTPDEIAAYLEATIEEAKADPVFLDQALSDVARARRVNAERGPLMRTENGMPPIHPGMFLREILTELGMSQKAFAQAIGVSPMRISDVIKGTRPVTAELALLFGKVFSQTPSYWMNLQTSYDLKVAGEALAEKVRQVQPLSRAA